MHENFLLQMMYNKNLGKETAFVAWLIVSRDEFLPNVGLMAWGGLVLFQVMLYIIKYTFGA